MSQGWYFYLDALLENLADAFTPMEDLENVMTK